MKAKGQGQYEMNEKRGQKHWKVEITELLIT